MSIDRAKVTKQAENYLASGRTGKAIEEFLKLLEDNPKDLNLANRLGDLYLQENRSDQAVDMFKRAAIGFERDGFQNKSIAIYKKAYRAAPEDVDIASRLIDLYTKSHMTKEAIQLHLQLADSYIKKGLIPRALREFTKIVELEPHNIKNKLRLADLCSKEGQKSQAAEIYLESAEMLAADNMHSEAVQVLERAKALISTPQVFLTQSRLFMMQENYVGAKNSLEEGLKANPKDAELLEARVEIELQRHQSIPALEILASMPQLPESALPLCERALKECHIKGSIQQGLGIIHDNILEIAKRGLGDYAKLALHNALEKEPVPEYWLLLAEIAHQNGARDEQADFLKYSLSLLAVGDKRADIVRNELQSLGVNPSDFAIQGPPDVMKQGDSRGASAQISMLDPRQQLQVRQLLKEGEQLENAKSFDKAVETYQRLLEIEPTNIGIINRIAEIHKSAGMLTKAQVLFTKMAEVLAGIGKPQLALKCLDNAEELIPGSTRITRLMLGEALEAKEPEQVPELITQPSAPIALDVQIPPLATPDAVDIPLLSLEITPQDKQDKAIPLAVTEDHGLDADFSSLLPEALPVLGHDETPPSHPESTSSAPDLELFALPVPDAMPPPSPSPDGISESLRQALCSIDFQLDYGSPIEAKLEIEHALSVHRAHPELLKRLEGVEDKLKQHDTKKESIESAPDSHAFDLSDILGISLDTPVAANEMHDNTAASDKIQTAEEIFNAFKDDMARQVGGDDYDTYYNLGIGYKEMLLLDPAIDEFKKAMRDPERTLECCSMIAMCEEARGDNDAAMKWLRKGIQDPGFPPIDSIGLRYELANMLQRAGMVDESKAQFEEVEKLYPGYAP